MACINPKKTDQAALVIIGTGLAGYHTAKQWRLLDQTTPLIMVTQDDGAFYSKPQLSTVLARKKTPDGLVMKTAEQMAQDLDATIYTHMQVLSINKDNQTIVLNNQDELIYRDCVLATGAKVHQLSLPDAILSELYTVNSLSDYHKLYQALQLKPKARVVIIGAGLVGCELSNDLVMAGYDVAVVALDAWPMARFLPEALGNTALQACADAGINWHLNTPIKQIEKQDAGDYMVHCGDAENTQLEADIVISAIGFRPHTHLAKRARLDVDQAICVNARLQTSDSHIFALGDCAQISGTWRPFIAPILHAGKVLAHVLYGDESMQVDFPVMPIIAKTPLCKMQGVFVNQQTMKTYRCDINEAGTQALYYDEQDVLRAFALCDAAVLGRAKLQAKLGQA